MALEVSLTAELTHGVVPLSRTVEGGDAVRISGRSGCGSRGLCVREGGADECGGCGCGAGVVPTEGEARSPCLTLAGGGLEGLAVEAGVVVRLLGGTFFSAYIVLGAVVRIDDLHVAGVTVRGALWDAALPTVLNAVPPVEVRPLAGTPHGSLQVEVAVALEVFPAILWVGHAVLVTPAPDVARSPGTGGIAGVAGNTYAIHRVKHTCRRFTRYWVLRWLVLVHAYIELRAIHRVLYKIAFGVAAAVWVTRSAHCLALQPWHTQVDGRVEVVP